MAEKKVSKLEREQTRLDKALGFEHVNPHPRLVERLVQEQVAEDAERENGGTVRLIIGPGPRRGRRFPVSLVALISVVVFAVSGCRTAGPSMSTPTTTPAVAPTAPGGDHR